MKNGVFRKGFFGYFFAKKSDVEAPAPRYPKP